MSMYTQLLEAAFGQRPTPGAGATEQDAHEEVIRCRRELQKGVPLGTDPDTVPVTLALQIGYDVALRRILRVAIAELKTGGEQWSDNARQDLVSTLMIQAARDGAVSWAPLAREVN